MHVQPSVFCFPSGSQLFLSPSNLTWTKTTIVLESCWTNFRRNHVTETWLLYCRCWVWTLLKTILIKKKKKNTPQHWSALLAFRRSTIWYELHAREWPYKSQPAEVIIWQIGSGMKPNLAQTGMGKEILVRTFFNPFLSIQYYFIYIAQ